MTKIGLSHLCLSAGTGQPELLEKARETPDRMTDADWRQLLSSVQYQVTRYGWEKNLHISAEFYFIQIVKLRLLNFEPSLFLQFELQYRLFRVSTRQLKFIIINKMEKSRKIYF